MLQQVIMNKLFYERGPHTGSLTGVFQIIDDCADYCAKASASPLCRQTSTYLHTHNTETAQHVTCREELQRRLLLCSFHLLSIFYNQTMRKGEGEQQVMESPLGALCMCQ